MKNGKLGISTLIASAVVVIIVGFVFTIIDSNKEYVKNNKTNNVEIKNEERNDIEKKETETKTETNSTKEIKEETKKEVKETKTETKTETKKEVKETKTETKTETKKETTKTNSNTTKTETTTKVETKTETKKDNEANININVSNNNSVIINDNGSSTTNANSTKPNNNTNNSQNANNNNQTTNTPTNQAQEPTQIETVDLSKIVSDKTIIPDKYNTGVKGSLTKYNFGMDLGLLIKLSGNAVVFNFTFKQNHIPEITIQNMDFTGYDKVAIYGGGENATDSKIKLIFKNCKFNFVSTPANLDTDITVEFQNCSIQNFGGSNASFNKCFFGGSSHDGMNPHRNVTVKNSYFAGINTYDAQNARHYDGVQMYGSNTIDNLLVENLKFTNCRFEVPAINEVRNGVPSKSGVNAPIMFALEYDNGNNVTFENIIANGGGYSVYAGTKNGVSYKNLTFKNVKIGYAHLFGILYPMTDANKANTKFINFDHYDSLYVSSVWKDNKGVHVITTNDTLIERKLTCETDKGNFNFNMPAHPKLTRENNNTFKFSQMPYDIDNTITNKDIKYVKCYDTTNTDTLSNENLIRTQKF